MAARKALILVTGHTVGRLGPTVDQRRVLGGIDDKPMILHQIEQLRSLVSEIILAVDFLEEPMKKQLANLQDAFGVKITCCVVRRPYGSGGWLAVAKQKGLLAVDGDGPFFLLRSDIICHYPLTKMITFHEFHKREATMVIKWEDRIYSDEDAEIEDIVTVDGETGMVKGFASRLDPDLINCHSLDDRSFTEGFKPCKPDPYKFSPDGGYVNAGIYLLNPSVINKANLTYMSLEKQILPALADEGNLYALQLKGVHVDLVDRGFDHGLISYRDGSVYRGRNPRLWVDEGSCIEPNVIFEPNCKVDADASLSNCVLMNGVQVRQGASVEGSIIGRQSIVGEGATISDMSVIGEEVEVHKHSRLVGAVVLVSGRKVGWFGTKIKHAISVPPDVDLGASTSGSKPPGSP